MSHPNTLAGLISGGIATGAVYVLNTYLGTHLTLTDGGLIATGLIATVLFVGRRGIKGTLSDLWNGSSKPKAAAKPPAPKTPAA